MAIIDLKRKTIKGASWTFVSQISRIIITMFVTAVLARLLEPSDFGLVAMVTVFTVFFAMFNDIGLASAIIQKQEVTETQLSSLFWVNLIEGLIVSVICLSLAPLIARFYSESRLTPMIMVMSSLFVITSFCMVQKALFSKNMAFRVLALVEITGFLTGGVVAVTFAAFGFGAWSIVLQMIIQSFVISALLFLLSKWKPKFILKWKPIKGFLSFGIPLLGFHFVNYFNRNLDNMLIGRFLGPAQLGFYNVAYKTMLFPLTNISEVIGRVMFPALSHIQDDKDRIRRAYIKANRYIALVTFPLTTAIAIFAPQIVRVMLGSKWERAIFLIQILAGIGGLQSLYSTQSWIYLSQGRTVALFIFGVVITIIFAGSFVVGLHWQVEGVAIAYSVAFLAILYPSFAVPFHFIDMKFFYFVRQFATIVAATLCMASVMIGLRLLFERVINIGDLPILITALPAGILFYFGTLLLIDRDVLKGLKGIVQDAKSREPDETK